MNAVSDTADLVVVGGGLLGVALAWGVARLGRKVLLLDEGDIAFRAARGNFGLVWVQGKGYGFPAYARWTVAAARLWPQLAAALQDETGVDVHLQQSGGFHLCHGEEELQARHERLQRIRSDLGGDYPFEFFSPHELQHDLPGLGPAVTGVSFCPLDGHANPLKVLQALFQAGQQNGVQLRNGLSVTHIEQADGEFRLRTSAGELRARQVVLAAGLGNRALAPMLGLRAPVIPNRGHVLVTERMGHFLDRPTTHIRQTDEGTVQIGESMEEVGLDDGLSTGVLQRIAARAARSFPALAGLQLVRMWSALRVMSPDGYPIYAESASCPGAFLVTCHSGVTLAAAHALRLAPWLAGIEAPADIGAFTDRRFPAAPGENT